ncbi:uncharacterized protein [Nicotiana tomentosiformis]|uniref:uncharacterized protein n=1 Tax=Nicotiana tomentosiformis TaxID=4098 RepID=UPI00388C7E24
MGLPTFSEEALKEARELKTPDMGRGSSVGDPFRDCFTGVDDASNISDASLLLEEAQHFISWVMILLIKQKGSAQAKRIEELETRFAEAKVEVESSKVLADKSIAVYRADPEAAQMEAREAADTSDTRAYWVAELAKCRSRRETLEDVHARGFDLVEEIKKAKELEAEVEALTSDGDNDDNDGIGKDTVMNLSGEEETSIPAPKPAKDKKRKKTSSSKDPEPKKKKKARKPRKNIILLTEESVRHLREEDEEEGEDGSGQVARAGMSTEAPKATKSVKAVETPSRDEGVSGKDLGEVPEWSRIEDAFNYTEPTLGMDIEAPRGEASTLHREECSRSQTELSRYEADIQRLIDERNSFNLLSKKKEEQIKGLRAELATTHKDQTDLIEQVMKILKAHGLNSGTVANISISQLQQKIKRIEQFREEVDTIKVESLGWKEGMDRFAAEKEIARDQLSSVESQFQGIKEKILTQARKIDDLEARLASKLAKAKSKAEKAKVEADAIVAVYRTDAETAQVQVREAAETTQTRAYWIFELARCQSRRETLEEIHARGFNLTNEIVKARKHEAEAGALATSDDDDDGGRKSGYENEEDLDGEEAAPEEDQEP